MNNTKKTLYAFLLSALSLSLYACSAKQNVLYRFSDDIFYEGEYGEKQELVSPEKVFFPETCLEVTEPQISIDEAVDAASKMICSWNENSEEGNRDFWRGVCEYKNDGEFNRLILELACKNEDCTAELEDAVGLSFKSMNHILNREGGVKFVSDASSGSSQIVIAGDICLADDWENMVKYYERGEKLEECISFSLLERMRSAGLCVVNNEFCFSDRGEPLELKYYTFRAKPQNVDILKEMSVDCVTLANNHVYDYGYDAFIDTMGTLDDAGIDYFGAGKNLAEAMEARYYIVGGRTLALVAASRAEKFLLTPEAKDNKAGVLRTYNTRQFVSAIKTAAQKADYVIAMPHWGTEYTEELEEAQLSQAKEYINAGASAVIGSHPHCLQGMEYYKGCLTAYSLGNFWFNHDKGDTMLLECCVGRDGLSYSIIPCTQDNAMTSDASDSDEGKRILNHLEEISSGVVIEENGRVRIKGDG